MRKIENNRRSLKILSAALLGVAALGSPAIAQETQPVLGTEETVELLKNKPADTPTLYYLHQNNVLIPQKGEYNKTDKTWADADPIEAPESVYKITTGTEEDHTFDYTTADIEGNLTHNYYKIELRHPEQSEGALNLGTSDHIEWKKLETAPAEGTPSTISIKVSDTETQYYQYTYTKPENYEETSTRIDNTLTTENSQYKVFKDKTATSSHGGAIYNSKDKSTVDIIADFINNSATSSSSYVYGGAIYNNYGKIGNITGDFINNSTSGKNTYGGAIYNDYNSPIGNITGDFINNSATGSSAYGGAIYNYYGTIGNITGDFINNSATGSSSAKGGAIYKEKGTIGAKDSDGNVIGGIINSNFIGNFAKSESGTSKGGAIYSITDLNIIADGATSTFKDNYTQVSEEKDDNAIYLDNVDGTLNFQLKNNGQIAMYDNIRGKYTETTETDEAGNEITKITDTYKVTIQGDGTNTTFHLLNDIYNANVSMGNTTINTLNNLTHTYNFNSLTLTGNTNFIADVDLANAEMDRFTAATYGEHQGNLNVVGMNLLSDATSDKTEVFFAEQGLKNNVTTNVKELSGYTPIYKYNVTYNNKPDGGYFVFQRGSNGGNSSDAFNPAVLSSPIATAAATQATVNETFKYVFEHADAFTQLPSVERISRINLNKYALNQEKYNGYSTDYNTNLGSLNPTLNNKAGWFRPYVTFENMHLNHGPKVNAITYGSLVGYDTDFKKHKHGWYSVGTGYIGYNGSQLNYSNTDTTMNGGLLGYTHTFYKGNFWSALTATAGASVGESKSMYGKENFTTLLAGIGSKTGYNFEFKKGKFIVQPIMFMSYTFANTFDYTNAAGVKINNSPAHSIQLNPSVRFIANTKTGWQPYASVGMVWNVMNENKVTANNVRLPEMSMKPYVEYGLGLQRNWKDKFTAFGQAMIRNGGRNGIALTAGFRWSLGKDSKPIEKVNNETLKRVQGDKGVNVNTLSKGEGRVRVQSAQPTVSTRTELENRHSELVSESQSILGGKVPTTANRTVLKQLTPTQKNALGTKPQNTTRTTNSAILKQL